MADHTKAGAVYASQGQPDCYDSRRQRYGSTARLAEQGGPMKALLLSEYRRLELAEVETPRPQAGEVLVRVAACGICGSDVHGYDGSSGRRIPPIIMGHEAAGI